jgi:hypothetical protein
MTTKKSSPDSASSSSKTANPTASSRLQSREIMGDYATPVHSRYQPAQHDSTSHR